MAKLPSFNLEKRERPKGETGKLLCQKRKGKWQKEGKTERGAGMKNKWKR